MLKVKEAEKELKEKSYREIQKETAWKWASRAAASYEQCVKVKKADKLVHWTIAEEFYHEAVEHAALVEGEEDLLKSIREAVHPYMEKAAEIMSPSTDKEDLDII